MMKKWICALLALLILLSVTGCYSNDPENPDPPVPSVGPETTDPAPENTQPPVNEAPLSANDLVGSYRMAEDGGHYIRLCQWGSFFTIEHYALDMYGEWIWGEEFWPNEDGWPTEQGQPVVGLTQLFAVVTGDMLFDDRPLPCSIALTEEGIAITKDGTTTQYIRDDNYPNAHTTEQLLQQLNQEVSGLGRDKLLGSWFYWNGEAVNFMELREDGYCLYIHKPANEAPYIFEGAWGINGEQLVFMGEMLGASYSPMLVNLTWSYNAEYDELTIYDEDRYLLWEYGIAYLCAYNSEVHPEFGPREAFGYVEYMFDEWAYNEDGNVDADGYMYQVPRLVGYTQTISQINEEIYYDFGTLAEQGMYDYYMGNPPEWQGIYYEMYWEDTVIVLMVHSYTDGEEYICSYYYDTATDTRLFPEDLLEMWGIDRETYLANLREQAEDTFYNFHTEYTEEEMAELGADVYLAWTLSDDNLNVYRPVYKHPDGMIVTYIMIEAVDGSYWTPIYLWTEESVG